MCVGEANVSDLVAPVPGSWQTGNAANTLVPPPGILTNSFYSVFRFQPPAPAIAHLRTSRNRWKSQTVDAAISQPGG
jgi:hypothetical protein